MFRMWKAQKLFRKTIDPSITRREMTEREQELCAQILASYYRILKQKQDFEYLTNQLMTIATLSGKKLDRQLMSVRMLEKRITN